MNRHDRKDDWRDIKPAHERAGRELKRLLPRHQRIMSLHLLGMTSKSIAETVGISPTSIAMITGSPIFQSEVARRQTNIEAKEDEAIATGVSRAREIIDNASANAAQTQVDLLVTGDPRLKHSAAKDILDRALGSKSDGTPGIGTIVLEEGAIKLLQLTMNEVRETISGDRLKESA